MRNLLYIMIAGFISILFSCSKENDLGATIVEYDETFTDLPAYSEWGYNTFGAYIDREAFIQDFSIVPGKIIIEDSVMTFILDGKMGGRYSFDRVTLTFLLKGIVAESYTDLLVLNDSLIDLKNIDAKVILKNDSITDTLNILTGSNIHFKRAQKLVVDNSTVECILSGTFMMKYLKNGVPTTISNGRFDLGFDDKNFYFIE